MLAYLSRYTHRVAIANSRLVALDDNGVTFRWKDYRARGKTAGNAWIKTMTLPADEFIRRFLLHVLPDGFHRIRHYGLFAGAARAANVTRIRDLIDRPRRSAPDIERNATPDPKAAGANAADNAERRSPCPCCGGHMTVIERFAPGTAPRTRPGIAARIDTS